jgi:hypothetical protein
VEINAIFFGWPIPPPPYHFFARRNNNITYKFHITNLFIFKTNFIIFYPFSLLISKIVADDFSHCLVLESLYGVLPHISRKDIDSPTPNLPTPQKTNCDNFFLPTQKKRKFENEEKK